MACAVGLCVCNNCAGRACGKALLDVVVVIVVIAGAVAVDEVVEPMLCVVVAVVWGKRLLLFITFGSVAICGICCTALGLWPILCTA